MLAHDYVYMCYAGVLYLGKSKYCCMFNMIKSNTIQLYNNIIVKITIRL